MALVYRQNQHLIKPFNSINIDQLLCITYCARPWIHIQLRCFPCLHGTHRCYRNREEEQGEQGCPHRGMACEPDLTFHQAEEEEEQTLQVRVKHKQRQEDVIVHQVGLAHRVVGSNRANKMGQASPGGS